MKVLYIDFEQGYKSLGSTEDITKSFGYPMIQFDKYSDFKKLLGSLFERKVIHEEVQIGTVTVPQESTKWVRKPGVELDCIVLDTGTELVKKYQRELQGTKDKLTIQQWGQIKNQLDVLMNVVNQLPCSVIVNTHVKPMRDDELGLQKLYPAIEGSTKEDVGKWFDFVLYTKVDKDKTGKRNYIWVTGRDERYCHAKDRSQALKPEMLQDYSKIFDVVKEKGWSNAKVLCIGDPGSGKTLSLKTINKEGSK
jgi:hypothetical protein